MYAFFWHAHIHSHISQIFNKFLFYSSSLFEMTIHFQLFKLVWISVFSQSPTSFHNTTNSSQKVVLLKKFICLPLFNLPQRHYIEIKSIYVRRQMVILSSHISNNKHISIVSVLINNLSIQKSFLFFIVAHINPPTLLLSISYSYSAFSRIQTLEIFTFVYALEASSGPKWNQKV